MSIYKTGVLIIRVIIFIHNNLSYGEKIKIPNLYYSPFNFIICCSQLLSRLCVTRLHYNSNVETYCYLNHRFILVLFRKFISFNSSTLKPIVLIQGVVACHFFTYLNILCGHIIIRCRNYTRCIRVVNMALIIRA